MARPRKMREEKRNEQLNIRLTTAEIEFLRSQASQAGVCITDYVRRRGLGLRLPTQSSSRSDPALISELNRIGVNVNQLARATHRGSAFTRFWNEIGAELQDALRKLVGDHGS